MKKDVRFVVALATLIFALTVALVSCAPPPEPPKLVPAGTTASVTPYSGDFKYCAMEILNGRILRSYNTDLPTYSSSIALIVPSRSTNGIGMRYFYAAGTGQLFLLIVDTPSCAYAEGLYQNNN